MGEMNNEEIEQRFNEIVDGIDGKRKSVAEMTTASALLDEQQRRIMEFHAEIFQIEVAIQNRRRELSLSPGSSAAPPDNRHVRPHT